MSDMLSAYTPKEAAMLANACIASATASAPFSLHYLAEHEDRVLKSVKKATGTPVSELTVNKAIEAKGVASAMFNLAQQNSKGYHIYESDQIAEMAAFK